MHSEIDGNSFVDDEHISASQVGSATPGYSCFLCLGTHSVVAKLYYGCKFCNKCWNGVRARHAKLKASGFDQDDEVQFMLNSPDEWRPNASAYIDPSPTSRAAARKTTENEAISKRSKAKFKQELSLADKTGLTRVRYQNYHAFWDNTDKAVSGQKWDELFRFQSDLGTLKMTNDENQNVVWIEDNPKSRSVTGEETRDEEIILKRTPPQLRNYTF
jgi:hypothetical protein